MLPRMWSWFTKTAAPRVSRKPKKASGRHSVDAPAVHANEAHLTEVSNGNLGDRKTASLPRRSRQRAPSANHAARPRNRRLDQSLLHAIPGVIAPRTAQKLCSFGVLTVGDLHAVVLNALAKKMTTSGMGSQKLNRIRVMRWRTTLVLLAELPEISPLDAALLIAIHRSSASSLAQESPRRLHADLRRFLHSSEAQRRFQSYPVPNPETVEGWILAAKKRFSAA